MNTPLLWSLYAADDGFVGFELSWQPGNSMCSIETSIAEMRAMANGILEACQIIETTDPKLLGDMAGCA